MKLVEPPRRGLLVGWTVFPFVGFFFKGVFETAFANPFAACGAATDAALVSPVVFTEPDLAAVAGGVPFDGIATPLKELGKANAEGR